MAVRHLAMHKLTFELIIALIYNIYKKLWLLLSGKVPEGVTIRIDESTRSVGELIREFILYRFSGRLAFFVSPPILPEEKSISKGEI
jgi:hypothetical protein